MHHRDLDAGNRLRAAFVHRRDRSSRLSSAVHRHSSKMPTIVRLDAAWRSSPRPRCGRSGRACRSARPPSSLPSRSAGTAGLLHHPRIDVNALAVRRLNAKGGVAEPCQPVALQIHCSLVSMKIRTIPPRLQICHHERSEGSDFLPLLRLQLAAIPPAWRILVAAQPRCNRRHRLAITLREMRPADDIHLSHCYHEG